MLYLGFGRSMRILRLMEAQSILETSRALMSLTMTFKREYISLQFSCASILKEAYLALNKCYFFSLMASKIAFLAFAFHFNCSVVGVPVNPVLVANHTSGAIASRYAAMRTFQ